MLSSTPAKIGCSLPAVVTSILAGVDLAFLLATLALIYLGWGPVRFSCKLHTGETGTLNVKV